MVDGRVSGVVEAGPIKPRAEIMTSLSQERDGSYTLSLLVVGLATFEQVEEFKVWARDAIAKYLEGRGIK